MTGRQKLSLIHKIKKYSEAKMFNMRQRRMIGHKQLLKNQISEKRRSDSKEILKSKPDKLTKSLRLAESSKKPKEQFKLSIASQPNLRGRSRRKDKNFHL